MHWPGESQRRTDEAWSSFERYQENRERFFTYDYSPPPPAPKLAPPPTPPPEIYDPEEENYLYWHNYK